MYCFQKNIFRKIFPEVAFWKKILIFALPIAFQNMSTAILGIIDVSIISDMGETAVASVSLANQLVYIASLIIFGITSGAQVYLSRYYGEKNTHCLKETFSLMMFFTLLINTLIMLMCLIIPNMAIGFFTDDKALIAGGVSYIRVAAPLFVFSAISNSYAAFFRSVGIPKIPMITTIVSLLVKLALDMLLIYGFAFIPAMGIKGAAMATLISKIVEFSLYLFFMLRHKEREYVFRFKDISFIKLRPAAEFIKRTYPVILNESLWGMGTSFFNAIFGRMGEQTISAMSIAMNMENLGNSFFYGISIGCCVSISFVIGQKKLDKAKQDAKKYALAGFYVGTGIMLLMLAIDIPYVKIFFSNLEAETQRLAIALIAVYACYMPFRSLASVFIMGNFRAGDDSRAAMLLDVLPVYLWSLPLGYLMGIKFHFGAVTVLTVMQFKRFIKAMLALRHFTGGKWLRVLDDKEVNYELYNT